MAIVICVVMTSRRNTGFLLFSRSYAAARLFHVFIQLSVYCLWPFFADLFGELFIFQLLKLLVQPVDFSSILLYFDLSFCNFFPSEFFFLFFSYSLLLVLPSLVMLGIGVQRFVWRQVLCPSCRAAGFVEKEKVKNLVLFLLMYCIQDAEEKLIFSVLSCK